MSRRPTLVAKFGILPILCCLAMNVGCRTAKSSSTYTNQPDVKFGFAKVTEPQRDPAMPPPPPTPERPTSALLAHVPQAVKPEETISPLPPAVAPSAFVEPALVAPSQMMTAVVGNELAAKPAHQSPPAVVDAQPLRGSGIAQADHTESKTPVQLVVKNVRAGQGLLKVAVFTTPENFPEGERADTSLTLDTSQATVHTPLAVSGRVAIAVYQDLNSDGQLNRNRLGVPTEPFAFSNNALGKRGPPAFEQAALAIGSDSKSILIDLH